MTMRKQITTQARTQVRADAVNVSEAPLWLILAAVALGMLVSTLLG
jgi:hypothetical protein